MAEALAEVLRRGLAAARQRPTGNSPPALPRLAKAELAVQAGGPAAVLQLRLDDGREVATTLGKTDLTALRRMLDEAIGRLTEPEHPVRPTH